MPTDPNLKVSLLAPDEAPIYTQIRHNAFRHDINKIFYSLAPNNEPSPESLSSFSSSVQDGILNKGIIFLKCVDTTTNEIVAGARWSFHRPSDPNAKERNWDEIEKELVPPEPYPETDVRVWNALFELFGSNKKEHMGTRPYCSLDTLVTHEKHYRRGAGRLLLEYALKMADEAGLETYLESSPMGRPLYERFGFEPIKDVSLDLRRWGGSEELSWTLMKRPAKVSRVNGAEKTVDA